MWSVYCLEVYSSTFVVLPGGRGPIVTEAASDGMLDGETEKHLSRMFHLLQNSGALLPVD